MWLQVLLFVGTSSLIPCLLRLHQLPKPEFRIACRYLEPLKGEARAVRCHTGPSATCTPHFARL